MEKVLYTLSKIQDAFSADERPLISLHSVQEEPNKTSCGATRGNAGAAAMQSILIL